MRRWIMLPMILAMLCGFESFETQDNAEFFCRGEGWDVTPALFADCIEYRYQYNAPKRPGRMKMGVEDYICQRKRGLDAKSTAYGVCLQMLTSKRMDPIRAKQTDVIRLEQKRQAKAEAERKAQIKEDDQQMRKKGWIPIPGSGLYRLDPDRRADYCSIFKDRKRNADYENCMKIDHTCCYQ